jgi:hypothetical protein
MDVHLSLKQRNLWKHNLVPLFIHNSLEDLFRSYFVQLLSTKLNTQSKWGKEKKCWEEYKNILCKDRR